MPAPLQTALAVHTPLRQQISVLIAHQRHCGIGALLEQAVSCLAAIVGFNGSRCYLGSSQGILRNDMPASPWRSFGNTEPEREYLALLSFLPLKSFLHLPTFLWGTAGVIRQLAAAQGLMAYSLLARPIRKNFWTLSVWQDEAALKTFIDHPPHVRLMSSLAPHMGETNFVRWKVKGSQLPLLWDDVLRRCGQR